LYKNILFLATYLLYNGPVS